MRFLAALVWGAAWMVEASIYSVRPAWASAFVGGAAGYWTGSQLAKTRVRTPVALAALTALFFGGLGLAGVPADTPLVARLLGAEVSYYLSDVLRWGVMSSVLTMILRFLSARYPSLVALEMVVVAGILASPFTAHREGFINRPYFLVDPLWARGYDPVPVLLGLGAVSAAVLVVLSIGRTSKRSTFLDLILMLAFIGLLFLLVPERMLRDLIPEPKGGGSNLNRDEGGKGDKGGKSDKDKDKDKMDNSGGGGGESPVAVVVLREDYDPPAGYYYFRSGAFSQFNGKRLVVDTTGRYDEDIVDHYPSDPSAPLLVKNPPHNPYHFKKIRTLVAMIQTHPKPFGLVDPMSMAVAQNPNPRQFVRAYEVESLAFTTDLRSLMGSRAGGREWDEDHWKHYTDIPADPRYKKLTQEIVSQLEPAYQKDQFAQAVAVKLYLDKTVTYTFTNAMHDQAPDPVAHYLFENPRGYCVHQAHAAVYLMRALGLPARVGVGYATDARNRVGGSTILLRDRESHAWPEVFIEDLGWVILDISPEKTDVPQMQPPDPSLQRMLGEMARENESKDKEEQEKFEKKSLQQVLREQALSFSKLLLFALAFLLASLYGVKGYRRLLPHLGTPEQRTLASYRAALDSLADVGLRRRYGQGRQDFAEQVAEQYPSLRPLTNQHLAQSLGRSPADPQGSIEALKGLDQEIRRHHPLWKIVLGWLNPFSWIRVK